MPVHIAFVCDVHDCVVQTASFDRETETWGDLLGAFRGIGWLVITDDAKVVKCRCPEHARTE